MKGHTGAGKVCWMADISAADASTRMQEGSQSGCFFLTCPTFHKSDTMQAIVVSSLASFFYVTRREEDLSIAKKQNKRNHIRMTQ